MASLRSKLLNTATRFASRLLFRPREDVTGFRKMFARTDRRRAGALAAGICTEEQEMPVAGRWLHNGDGAPDKVILYLHGGAFILRLPESHTAMVSLLCRELGASAFLPWYRLAPEHPFPAAPEDCLAAYRYLLESHAPGDIVVMGDSAGGNLTLSLLNQLKREGLPQPAAAVALSPPLDFAQISATWLLHRWTDPMYVVQPAVAPQRYYLNADQLTDPIASPVYGDLAGLPPVLLLVGSVEALRDDVMGYARAATLARTPVQVHVWGGMPHVHMLQPFLPETALARERVCDWVQCALRGEFAGSGPSCLKDVVILFNRRPLLGGVSRFSNSDADYMRDVL